jgi:membrane peptidoglycan carboxypeptidase
MAMIGSANANDNGGQYNFAVWPPRNPGSSMKIFNYTAAIASGMFTMVSPVPDSPISVPQGPGQKPWTPQNYDGRTHGTCQLQACFLNSLNIPAVRVELGLPHQEQDTAAMARTMGAPPWTYHGDTGKFTDDDPLDSYGPSLTLGGYGETPLQMAQGASVLAAQGVLRPAHGVAKILSPDGQVLFDRGGDQDAKQVIDPKVAYIMEQIMSDDSNRAMIFGRGSNLTLPDRPVASKTGTTDDFKDGWTVGYTPAIATAFWFGNPDWSAMGRALEASVVAAPVWHDFMEYALRDSLKRPNNEWFGEPAGLLHYYVGGKLQWFLPGTSPSTPTPAPRGVLQVAPKSSSPTEPAPAPVPVGGGGAPPPGHGKKP